MVPGLVLPWSWPFWQPQFGHIWKIKKRKNWQLQQSVISQRYLQMVLI
jgi:hypothetical protein